MTAQAPLPTIPLAPCPFCGRAPQIITVTNGLGWHRFEVACYCGASITEPTTDGFYTPDQAAEAWNRRTK